jgi:hypothetical protein
MNTKILFSIVMAVVIATLTSVAAAEPEFGAEAKFAAANEDNILSAGGLRKGDTFENQSDRELWWSSGGSWWCRGWCGTSCSSYWNCGHCC